MRSDILPGLWRAEALAAIVTRLGVPDPDLTPPVSRRVTGRSGLSLHLLDWGGEGPPVLLHHGGALTCQTWDYVAVALRRRFRLLALDMRGHGASGWASDYHLARFAEDSLDVLNSLGIERAHLCGMSLGGVAAAETALAAPHRALSLTMIDVGPGSVFEASARLRGFIQGINTAPSVEHVVTEAMRLNPLGDRERVYYRMRALLRDLPSGEVAWKRDSRRMTDFPHIMRRIGELTGRVGAFPAPALIIRGGRSRMFLEDSAAAFAALFPDGRQVTIAGAGHNVQEDQPLALASALIAFWAGRNSPETGGDSSAA